MGKALCRVWLLLSCVALSGMVRADVDPVDLADRRILTARDAATRGDAARLEQLLATPSTHPLEPYIGYWLHAARLARGLDATQLQAMRAWLDTNEGSYLAERLRSDWLKRIGREGPWSAFNEEYAKLQQPDIELQCFAIRAGNLTAATALQALDAQWLSLMDTPESCMAPLQSLLESGRRSRDDGDWRLRRLVEANRLTGARQMLPLLDDAPDAISLGRVFENPDRYLASAAAQNGSSRGARELVLAALARMRGDPRTAMARWRQLDDSRYSAAERAYALAQIGWGAAIALLPDANDWFARARALSPRLPMSDEQAAWQVRAALRVGDWAGVQASIERMGEAQRALPEWTYWRARALQVQGRTAEAQALYERHAGQPNFYGILAAEALGRSLLWPQPAQPPSVQEMQRVEATGDVQRAAALLRLNMRTEGQREWAWALRNGDDRWLLACAEFARRLGYYDRAIAAADRTRSQHDYSLRYLAPYYDVFAREARVRQLDLHWLYGLTRQESRFVISARSSVGAQGLMQIMPATGRMVARQIGVTDYAQRDLAETGLNVQLGTAYLRSVLDSLASSPVMATAAYNAGPGRARRWRDTRPLEAAIYAETIPITETRDYVKKVLANTIAYAVLLDGRPMSLTRFMGSIPASTGESAGDPLP